MTAPASHKPEYFGKDLEAMSFAKNYHHWILAELAPYLRGAVAEVGAGVGSFSELLLTTDITRLRAFEPSGNMFPMLQQTLSADARADAVNGFFEGASHAGEFDTIVYVNVLEHIEDDAAELVGAYQALKPNGHLLIFVPALPWLYSNLDKQVGHFRRYRKKGLVELVERARLPIARVRYFDIAGIIPWYINFVLLKNSIGGGSVSLYDKLVVPPMRVIERLITPPIGKNLLLVAKKG